MRPLRRVLLLVSTACAFLLPTTTVPVSTKLNLFGGGKKEGGGALSNVASVMDQFKKAQEIAKKSQELQAALAATIVDGKCEGVTVQLTGQQTPVGASIESLDGFDGESLSAAFTAAFKEAQQKSLNEMNSKMQELYKEMGFGGPPPDEGGAPPAA